MPPTSKWHDEVFGFTYEPAVIVYNRNLIAPADVPLTHDALADLLRRNPQTFQGRVGTYDIARSGIGYLFGFYDALQSNSFGRLLEAFGRAEARLYCCTGELLKAIEEGSVLIGYNLLGSYAYGRYKAGAPIGIVMPGDYTLVLARAAFLPKRSANPESGKLFLDYLLSVRGQAVAAREAFYFVQSEPPPDGVLAPGRASEAGVYRQIPIGPELLAVTDRHKRSKLLAEWRKSFGDAPP
jgi:iron(III) transport system substrate-binding protein